MIVKGITESSSRVEFIVELDIVQVEYVQELWCDVNAGSNAIFSHNYFLKRKIFDKETMRVADFDVSFCLDYKVSPLHEDANRAARTGDMEVSQNMLMQKLMVKIKQQKNNNLLNICHNI